MSVTKTSQKPGVNPSTGAVAYHVRSERPRSENFREVRVPNKNAVMNTVTADVAVM